MTGWRARAGGLFRPGPAWVLYLFAALFFFITYAPLLALAGTCLLSPGVKEGALLPVFSERRLMLLARSVGLAALVVVTDLVLGVLAGLLLWQNTGRPARFLKWAVLLLIPLPLTVTALAWQGAVTMPWLATICSDPLLLAGLRCWWVASMAWLPLAAALAFVAFGLLDPLLVEAGRVTAPDLRVLVRVVLPLAAPLLLAGAGFLTIFCLVDYTIPSIFSFPVYSFEIFAEYSASNLPGAAFLLSLPLLLVTVPVVLVSGFMLKNVVQNSRKASEGDGTALSLPSWLVVLLVFAAGVVVLGVAVMAAGLLQAFTGPASLAGMLSAAAGDTLSTLVICAGATALSLPVAYALAHLLARPRSTVWWLFVMLPLAIPPPLTGIGLISFWNQGGPGPYGTVLMPVIAAAGRFIPVAAVILAARLRGIDPLLIDAARVLERNPLRVLYRVRLPLSRPALVIAAAFLFALSMGELGATLLVVPPGSSTLTIRLYNYLHYGATGMVAGVGLLMTGLFLAVIAAGVLAGRSRNRVGEILSGGKGR